MVLLNLPKIPVIPVIAYCEKENKISHQEMTTSTKLWFLFFVCFFLMLFLTEFPFRRLSIATGASRNHVNNIN